MDLLDIPVSDMDFKTNRFCKHLKSSQLEINLMIWQTFLNPGTLKSLTGRMQPKSKIHESRGNEI